MAYNRSISRLYSFIARQITDFDVSASPFGVVLVLLAFFGTKNLGEVPVDTKIFLLLECDGLTSRDSVPQPVARRRNVAFDGDS